MPVEGAFGGRVLGEGNEWALNGYPNDDLMVSGEGNALLAG